MLTMLVLTGVSLRRHFHSKYMNYSYVLVVLVLLGIILYDFSRKYLGIMTVLKMFIVGLVLFAIEFGKKHDSPWLIILSIACIMFSPFLVTGSFKRNKK